MTLFRTLEIPGCVEIDCTHHADERGCFVKCFQQSEFAAAGLETAFVEHYYSKSVAGVVRGLHLQLPPDDHAKLVYCVSGEVWDVCLDVRVGSPTFGASVALPLSAARHNAIYIPRGVAHGFCVERGEATLVYSVTSLHSPSRDSGVRWDSVGIRWPIVAPTVSKRDAQLPRWEAFESPFRWVGGERT